MGFENFVLYLDWPLSGVLATPEIPTHLTASRVEESPASVARLTALGQDELSTLQVAADAVVYTEMAAGDTTVGSTPTRAAREFDSDRYGSRIWL